MPSSLERANADGGLDAPVLALAGLGDAEVERIIAVGRFLGEPGNEKTVGLDHHLHVAGFHRENDVVVVVFAADADKFEGALHHAERGVAVPVQDPEIGRASCRERV